ncbi:MAG: bifunctional UDP-N-acetylglucosamine diphosphorylase/glucosamine-1-phosphate N-acetyltransferase GlmU [Alphaproteobacteria bacterium]|nr:bifunctional UDP-N-acetylglucosamine diphosphorylase/glucosamine-1-phosphate N-acetyltransferase GlmU [Alphaproteobacteria bacterium]
MTAARPLAVIVLAAGQGTRMQSPLPKVLHPIAGRTMLAHVLAAAAALSPDRVVVVTRPDAEAIGKATAPARLAVQAEQLGTGHAVMAARKELEGFHGDALVLYADTPLLTAETLRRILAARDGGASVAVLGFRPADPAAYGRLVLAHDGSLQKIVEAKDATSAERKIDFCNSGVLAADARTLFDDLLPRVGTNNAKKEYYLTDVIQIAVAHKLRCAAVEGAAAEVLGVNSQDELAVAEAAFQRRARAAHMAAGVTLSDPATVYFAADTEIGPGTSVGQNVVFGPGVSVAGGVTIKPFCHLEGVRIARGAIIGPFARLRPGSEIGEDVHIGNFVETKAAKIDRGAKANHLTYLGDVTIGAEANIGAGTITCNYDGFFKYQTEIGAGAFIGSNSALVAPVSVGANANIGAGSVITRNVAADALAIERSPQVEKPGWAAKFRTLMRARKAKKD